MARGYRYFLCTAASCRFRFPAAQPGEDGSVCPVCGAPTEPVSELRTTGPELPLGSGQAGPPVAIDVVLDNLRSVYNVGSIFRSVDGAGLRHVYLCGITPPPDHPRFAKTALGAEHTVSWSRHPNAVDLVLARRAMGARLWALEENDDARSLFDLPATALAAPILLVVGNENAGVDPGVLEQCDLVLALPMWGIKRSLNVATAFGIAAYVLAHQARAGR